MKIADKSEIMNAEITYVRNGQLVTQELVRDPNNVYKTLIDGHLPSAVVVTNAEDLAGKTATVVKVLNVTPLSNSILGQITNFLFGIGKSIVSIFRIYEPIKIIFCHYLKQVKIPVQVHATPLGKHSNTQRLD